MEGGGDIRASSHAIGIRSQGLRVRGGFALVVLLAVAWPAAGQSTPPRGEPGASSQSDVFERLLELLAAIPERWTSLGEPLVPSSGRRPGEVLAAARSEEEQQARTFLSELISNPPEAQPAMIRTWLGSHRPTEVDLWLPAREAERLRMNSPRQAALTIEAWMRWAEIAARRDVLLSAASDVIDLAAERIEPERLLPLARAWAALPPLPEPEIGRAHFLKSHAHLLMGQGEHEAALRALRDARAIFEALGDHLGRANAHRGEAKLLFLLDRHAEALAGYRQARELYERLGDPRGLGNAWDGEARAHLLMGEYEEALAAFSQARGFYEILDDQVGQGRSLNGEGDVLLKLDRYDSALDAFRQSRVLLRNVHDELNQGYSWEGEADVLTRMGRHDEALDAYRRARIYFETAGDYEDLVRTLTSTGDLLTIRDDGFEAVQAYLEARELLTAGLGERLVDRLAESLADLPRRWDSLGEPLVPPSARSPEELGGDAEEEELRAVSLFLLRLELDDPEKRPAGIHAWLALQRPSELQLWLPGAIFEEERRAGTAAAALTVEVWLAWAEAVGRRDVLVAAARRGIALVLERRNPDVALPLFEAWSALPLPEGSEDVRGRLLETGAHVLSLAGRYREALEIFARAGELFETAGNPGGRGRTRLHAANLLVLLGKLKPALEFYDEARTALAAADDPHNEGMALRGAGDVHFRLGDNEEALRAYRDARERFETTGDLVWQGHTWMNEGNVHFRAGDNTASLEAYGEARTLYGSAENRIDEARAYADIGKVLFRLGEIDAAWEAYRDARQRLEADDDGGSYIGQVGIQLAEAKILMGEGEVLRRRGETEAALSAYGRARDLFGDAGETVGQAHAWDSMGDVLFHQGKLEKALRAHRGARELFAAAKSISGEANTYLSEAKILHRQGENSEALEAYHRAGKLFQEIEDWIGLGSSLRGVAGIRNFLGENELALAAFQQARSHYEEVGSENDQGNTWIGEGRVLFRLGANESALKAFDTARSLFRAAGARLGEGYSYLYEARVHFRLGANEQALEAFRNASTHLEAVDDKMGQANALALRVPVLFRLGDNREAREFAKRALDLLGEIEASDQSRGNVLLEQAKLLFRLGEHEQALAASHTAHALFKAAGDVLGQGNSLLSQANVFRRLGEPEQARDAFIQARGFFKQVGSRFSEASTYHGEAAVLEILGEDESALEAYCAARTLFESVGDLDGKADTWIGEAGLLLDAGQDEQALAAYHQARSFYEQVGSKYGLGDALFGIASIESLRLDLESALEHVAAAGVLFAEIDETPYRISALGLEAQFLWLLGREGAVERSKAAIELHRDWRTHFLTDRHRIRSDESIATAYEPLISILVRQRERVPEALTYAEEARSRVLLDLLNPANADPARAAEMLKEVEIPELRPKTEGERRARQQELAQLEEKLGDVTDLPQKQKLREEFAKIERQLDWDHYLRLAARETTPGAREPLDADGIRKLAREIGPILLYYTTDFRTFGFLVRPQSSGIVLEVIEIPGSELLSQIDDFVFNLADLEQGGPQARDLWDQLIEPFAGWLPPGNLTLIPHGPLHQLPFAALLDPEGRPLFERWQVAVAPSVSSLAKSRERHAAPRSNDPLRTFSAGQGLGRTEREAEEIARFFDNHERVEASFRNYEKEVPMARHLFLASHGSLDEEGRRGAYLELRRDEDHDRRLSAAEIAGIPINAELVTLAACDTAAGRALLSDERLDLSRAFLMAGAAAILATRWKLPEQEATSLFLLDFYRAYRTGGEDGAGLRKDEALTLARRRSRERGDPAQVWAAWVLVGDAR